MKEIIDLEPKLESPPTDKIERALKRISTEAKTIADTFRIIEEELFERIEFERHEWKEAAIARLPIERQKQFRADMAEGAVEMRRYLEPWPNWAVHLAGEIFAIHLPSIPKAIIHEGLTLFHYVIFEWPIDRSVPFPENRFAPFDPALLGAMFGHTIARGEDMQRKLAECLKQKLFSPEKYAEFQQRLSPGKLLTDANHAIAECMKADPHFIVRYSDHLAHAKANTFDKKGNAKEPPLMPIYEKIFENWPKVERMSGPTELGKFLGPLLNESDPDKRMNRVKAIRRRLGIVFKEKGGTEPSNSPYLPQKI